MLSNNPREQMHHFCQPKSKSGECCCVISCAMSTIFLRNKDLISRLWCDTLKMSCFVLLLPQLILSAGFNTVNLPLQRYLSLCGVIKTAARQWHCLIDALIFTALIVHEGPSVFRIFHRWQAVNQQWKVLNYDKSMDSDDLKNTAVDRTLSQPSPGFQTGVGVSTSTSSLMVVASTAAGSTSTTVVTAAGGLGAHVDPNSGSTVPDQHCPYNILHLLSHLRQPEARSQPSNSTRELVMRVTTVWGVSWGLISHGGERFMNQLTVEKKVLS